MPVSTEELPAAAPTTASSPARAEEATGAPPPANATKREGRAPTPPPAEESEVPTPTRAGAASTAGSPGLARGPVMPSTATRGNTTVEEETQAASDDEVEEIEGRPRDGR